MFSTTARETPCLGEGVASTSAGSPLGDACCLVRGMTAVGRRCRDSSGAHIGLGYGTIPTRPE